MDGECSTLTREHSYARSLDSAHHPSRSWLKAFHSTIKDQIPEGWRVCGENLYATHSIHYTNLESYFLAFSIWDEKNNCLPYDEFLEWCQLIGVKWVPVLDVCEFDIENLMNLANSLNTSVQEGYVVRWSDGFHYTQFSQAVGKYVRAGHVQSDGHWMDKKVIPNELSYMLNLAIKDGQVVNVFSKPNPEGELK